MTAPLVLIPGGAATSRDYYPGLPEAFPAHRVVAVDRPGTGTAMHDGRATLPGGAAAIAAALRAVSDEPAVVVGQSLGGAVAAQLAIDFPELVAGLVLLDPTPFNAPKVLKPLRPVFRLLGLPGQLPLVGRQVDLAVWRLLSRSFGSLPEGSRASAELLIRSATIADTAEALRTVVDDGAALTARLRPLDVPAVLVTADRKPDHTVRLAHHELASALGARVDSWPGCVHGMQLKDPDKVIDVVRRVVDEARVSA